MHCHIPNIPIMNVQTMNYIYENIKGNMKKIPVVIDNK